MDSGRRTPPPQTLVVSTGRWVNLHTNERCAAIVWLYPIPDSFHSPPPKKAGKITREFIHLRLHWLEKLPWDLARGEYFGQTRIDWTKFKGKKRNKVTLMKCILTQKNWSSFEYMSSVLPLRANVLALHASMWKPRRSEGRVVVSSRVTDRFFPYFHSRFVATRHILVPHGVC